MISGKIEIAGFRELQQTLEQFGDRVCRNALAKAVEAGAQPILRIARAKAPERTGALRLSIDCVVRKYPQTQTAVAVIGPAGDFVRRNGKQTHVPARIAHLIEFGHRLVGKGKREVTAALRRGIRNARRAGAQAEAQRLTAELDTASRGFVAARPFMRPALDNGKREAAELITAELMKAIRKEIKRT